MFVQEYGCFITVVNLVGMEVIFLNDLLQFIEVVIENGGCRVIHTSTVDGLHCPQGEIRMPGFKATPLFKCRPILGK